MPNRAIFHFHYQLIAFHRDDFAALDLDYLTALAGRRGLFRLHLRTSARNKRKTECPSSKHEPLIDPTVA
jgi:hypothetical protein